MIVLCMKFQLVIQVETRLKYMMTLTWQQSSKTYSKLVTQPERSVLESRIESIVKTSQSVTMKNQAQAPLKSRACRGYRAAKTSQISRCLR